MQKLNEFLFNKKIKIIFRDKSSIVGILKSWEDNLMILMAEQNENLSFIFLKEDDIFMILVINSDNRKIEEIKSENFEDLNVSAQNPEQLDSNDVAGIMINRNKHILKKIKKSFNENIESDNTAFSSLKLANEKYIQDKYEYPNFGFIKNNPQKKDS